MQTRSVRLTALTLLLATPLLAAYFLWSIDRRGRDLLTNDTAVATRLDRAADALAGIGTAQQSYVAPGQLDGPWFERMSALVQQLTDDVTGVGPRLRSPDAGVALTGLADSIEALVAADGRTRQNLTLGQDLMAADVIFSDGRHLLDTMIARTRELRAAERAWHLTRLASLSSERWLVLGVAVLAWLGAGVVLAAPALARRRAVIEPAAIQPAPAEAPVAQGGTVDVAAAADLCTDLSRVTETAMLSTLLGRAAAILDASGVIVWMSAGEQLFAVLGHGYPAETVNRFGPIARDADNAAAAAWRAGRLTVVPGSERARGALVMPLFGPCSCIGVLALELRHLREQDPPTQAVATMIAAQLATAVAAWPAASLPQPAVAEPEARSA